MSGSRVIVVTGMGAVSAVGCGVDALWEAVASGRDGIRPIARFPTDEFTTVLGACVPGRDRADQYHPLTGATDLCVEFAIAAAQEAWRDAGLDRADLPPQRIGLALGTGLGDPEGRPHPLTRVAAEALGVAGPCLTVCTACSSSTNAIGLARHLLLSGAADAVLAGGVDVLAPLVFAGFHGLEVLSAEKCAPFSFPTGTTLGEGAGFLVLETGPAARERGCEPIAEVGGYGLSGDAYHETSPDPKGTGIARAMTWALADAGIAPSQVGYVNAHGSGTAANDPAEWRAIQRVLGPRAGQVPVSSTKSIIGHAQGAAGVLEAIVTLLAQRRGQVPQTLHHEGPRPHCPPDPVAAAHPRPHDYQHAVSINLGFGGANAAIVLSAPGARGALPGRRPSPQIEIAGLGAVGPHGIDLSAFASALDAGGRLPSAVAEFSINDLIPRADPRRLDPATLFLSAAAAAALDDAGVAVSGDLRDRIGIVLGAARVSPTSAEALDRSIETRGLARLSANAFARIILNAPAGTSAKLLSLRGPNLALSTGPGSGLAAVALAAQLLSATPGVELLLAGGVDELEAAEHGGDLGEGAGCVLLTKTATRGSDGRSRVALAGWALGAADDPDDTVARALDMAGVRRDDCQAAFGAEAVAPVLGAGDACSSVLACAAAALAVRRGEHDTVLVTAAGERSVSTALVLTGRGDGDES